ncbi:MAG: class I SAM-dependent methyltransferase [Polyangiaceae bacterium]|nr:class I SAM-dependent methyltransferase [Polyangiaceae bacterium]
MFTATARYYDALYAERDFEGEANAVLELAGRHVHEPRSLLDAACATGEHLGHFARRLGAAEVAGFDLDPVLVELARAKLPDVRVECADLGAFELGRRFDVVACLYGSIAYTTTRERLFAAVGCLARHLAPGGVLALDPFWMRAEDVAPLNVRHVVRGRLQIARLGRAVVKDGVAELEIHYLVGEEAPEPGAPPRIQHLTELHRCGVFSRADHEDALRAAGLEVHHEPRGPVGRGLFLGVARR